MTRQVKTYNPNHVFVDTNVLIGAYSGDARYQRTRSLPTSDFIADSAN